MTIHDIDPSQLIEPGPEPESPPENFLHRAFHVGKEVVKELVEIIGSADKIEAVRQGANHL